MGSMGSMGSEEPTDDRQEFEREFGRTIERHRARSGWTAEQAAKLAGISPKTWQRLEDGRPAQPLTLMKVDELFGAEKGTLQRVWQEEGDLEAELAKASFYGSPDNHPNRLGLGERSDPPSIPILSAARTSTGEWSSLGPDLADQIIDLLALLSIRQLDLVLAEASGLRQAKAVEVLRMAELVDPSALYRPLQVARLGWLDRLQPLVEAYAKATKAVLKAHDHRADTKRAYVRASSPENKTMAEQATRAYDAEVRVAIKALRAFADAFLELANATDVPPPRGTEVQLSAQQEVLTMAARADEWAKQAELAQTSGDMDHGQH